MSDATDLLPIEFDLPFPSAALGKNGRVSTRTRRKVQAEHRGWGAQVIASELRRLGHDRPMIAEPVLMDITWIIPNFGAAPDEDNAIARVSAYRDAAIDAGLIVDDANVYAGGFILEHGNPAVRLRFRHASGEHLFAGVPNTEPEPLFPAVAFYDLMFAIDCARADLDSALIECDSIDDMIGEIGGIRDGLRDAWIDAERVEKALKGKGT